MDLYGTFDVQLSEDAKTFPLSDDASIDLLPMGSEYARRQFEKMMEPYQPRLKAGGELTEEEAKKLNTRFFAEVIIKGWKGLKDKDKKDIKFTSENAYKLLEALPRFNAMIARMAADESAFEIKKTEEDEGNS